MTSKKFGKLLYGFLGTVVATISIVACLVYKAGATILISAIMLLVISVIFVVSGLNDK